MSVEFELDGFLSEKPSAMEADIARAYSGLFSRARQINRDCHDLVWGAKIHTEEGQEILVAALFLRALEHYQATILLLGIGLVSSAKVALRATLETVFATRAVARSDEDFRAFVNDDLMRRLKLINKAKDPKNDYPILAKLRAISDEEVAALKRQIDSFHIKAPLSTEHLSRRADLHEEYVTRYALLSYAVHSNVRELKEYFVVGASGEIEEIRYAPSEEESPDLIVAAANYLLLGAQGASRLFGIDFEGKRLEHMNAMVSLVNAVE